MKHSIKFLFLLAVILLPAIASAYSFEVDGIYYLIINRNEVLVTDADNDSNTPDYSGNVIIPETVTYNGTTYSVTSIDGSAFYGCSGLTSITIPNSVTEIGDFAFYNCSGLTSVTIPNSVTSIGGWAFYSCSSLTSINIPNSVTVIAPSAFGGCSGLTSITIPNSVTYICDVAFAGCSGLTSIVVDSNNTVYDSREDCNAIIFTSNNSLIAGCKTTIIPSSVTSIGDYAFYRCSSLTSIDIPNSVTSIGNYAFYNCNSLTSIDIPNSVTSIGSRAFYNCSSLTSIDIPNSVTYIGDEAFYNCSSLTSIDIPNSVTSIGVCAFEGCSGLTSVNIGNSVTSIKSRAFYHCSGLTSIVVDSNNTVLDSREDCNAIIETASNTLIMGCKATVIPNSVTSIGGYAFEGCSGLTSIDIPNSVTSIGYEAFYNCSDLNDVYSFIDDPTTVSMGSSVFYRSPNNYAERTLHVPVGTVSAYQAQSKWSQYFGSIVEMEPEPVLASSIEMNQATAELTEGETLQLTATVLPEDATDKTVTWTSSDEAVATVDVNGLVTAVAPGETSITATTNDGSDLSASCVVTVTSPVIPVGENVLQMADTTVMHGDIISLPVAMINEGTIMAFQTDVFLPEGFTIVTDEDDEYVITPSERLTSDHIIMSDNANNGAVRVICYTPNSQAISGNEGDLFYIHIQVPDDAEGDYTINVRNTLLTTASYNEVSIPDVSATITVNTYIPGDVNDSRTVNVTDIVVAAMFVLDQNPSPFIFEAADMNGDGNVTVTDIMLIAYLINHPAMNAPKRMPALMDCNDRMSAEGVTLMPGETRTVSIALDNEMDYSAFQLDLRLPDGLTASNFQLTDRAGSHAFDASMLASGDIRALCYSPAILAIEGHEGALLTFDVTATGMVNGDITVDGIELVTTDCQTVLLDSFSIGVNTATSVNEIASGKTVARVDYFNLAGQRIARPDSGVTLVVTTYTDGTRTTEKVIQ